MRNFSVQTSEMADEKAVDLEEVPVSCTDELVTTGDCEGDRLRKFGEYWRTNAPLSAVERRKRANGWVPRTMENIGDLEPLPETELTAGYPRN